MRHLIKFESYLDGKDCDRTNRTSVDYEENHNLGNLLMDKLSEKDIYPVRKPSDWEEVEVSAIDLDDLDDDILGLIFKLPVYEVNNVSDGFTRKEWTVMGDENDLDNFNNTLDNIYTNNNVRDNNFIFYEQVGIDYQYFIVHFKLPDFNCGLIVDTQGFDYMRYVLMIKDFDNLYDYYKKDLSFRECCQYIDSLLLRLDEGYTIDKIKKIWLSVVNKFKNLPSAVKKKVAVYTVMSLLAFTSVNVLLNVVHNNPPKDVVIKDAVDEALLKFKDPTQLRVSKEGRESIKEHERLRLSGYSIGDGHITIGYGHAEPARRSKFKRGQKISKEKAESLFNKDLTAMADGVRQIFADWKSEGINVKITQDQFDALVSMAYNMGVNGLRQSDMIQHLKLGNLKKAGELIKTTNINDNTFPGLRIRREKESKKFMSYLKDTKFDTNKG